MLEYTVLETRLLRRVQPTEAIVGDRMAVASLVEESLVHHQPGYVGKAFLPDFCRALAHWETSQLVHDTLVTICLDTGGKLVS